MESLCVLEVFKSHGSIARINSSERRKKVSDGRSEIKASKIRCVKERDKRFLNEKFGENRY
jgi:hypothetical protein